MGFTWELHKTHSDACGRQVIFSDSRYKGTNFSSADLLLSPMSEGCVAEFEVYGIEIKFEIGNDY